MRKLFLFFILVAFIINAIKAQSELGEGDLIKALFNGTYHRKIRPVNGANKQGPVEVEVNMYVRSIENIDDIKNEVDVQLTYRQQWFDERLSYNSGHKYLNVINPASLVWLPDTSFINAKEAIYSNARVWSEYFRVFPDGKIRQGTRIFLKLSCPMIFRYFPFDEPTCPIRLSSYRYTKRDIIYKWVEKDPVEVNSQVQLPTFYLYRYHTEYCDSVKAPGTYSCLVVNFHFKRKLGSYLINIYIPCTLMVIFTYLSFWIHSRALSVRIVLVAGTFFFCATHIIALNQTFPSTSYIKAVDIWNGACLTFIFAALVENIVVQRLETPDNDKKPTTIEANVGRVRINDPRGKSEKKCIPNLCCGAHSMSEKLDCVSRVAFSVAFVIFVSIYLCKFYFRSF